MRYEDYPTSTPDARQEGAGTAGFPVPRYESLRVFMTAFLHREPRITVPDSVVEIRNPQPVGREPKDGETQP